MGMTSFETMHDKVNDNYYPCSAVKWMYSQISFYNLVLDTGFLNWADGLMAGSCLMKIVKYFFNV